MRQAAIYVDLNVTEKGISKQLEYSNTAGIQYVAIIGEQGGAAGKDKTEGHAGGHGRAFRC